MRVISKLLNTGVCAGLLLSFSAEANANNAFITRFTNAGALEPTWPSGGILVTTATNLNTNDVVIQSDNKIVTCGHHGADVIVGRHHANGTVDTSYGWGGVTTFDNGTILDGVACARTSDNKIVVLASSGVYPYVDDYWLIVRFNANGTLDTGFGNGGSLKHYVPSTWEFVPSDIAVDPVSGKITAGISVNGDFVLARYWPSGALDTGFGWQGVTAAQSPSTTEGMRAIALHPTLGVVAVGWRAIAGHAQFLAMAFNNQGILNSAFNSSGEVTFGFPGYVESTPRDVAVDSNNRVVIVGQAGWDAFAIARVSQAGFLDGGFSNDGRQTAQAGGGGGAWGVAISAGNRPVVSGFAHSGHHQQLATARYNDDGSLDTGFTGQLGLRLTNMAGNVESAKVGLIGTSPVVAGTFFY
jgi:uncharacterized delta-60 repeat protein